MAVLVHLVVRSDARYGLLDRCGAVTEPANVGQRRNFKATRQVTRYRSSAPVPDPLTDHSARRLLGRGPGPLPKSPRFFVEHENTHATPWSPLVRTTR
jgi:hypothetical protein